MIARPAVAALLDSTSGQAAAPNQPEDVIQVSPATKRVAFAYERFRNTLEPDEEDILRRKAIYRILDRRLHEDRPPAVMAEQLLQELMRANYIQPVTRPFARYLAHRLTRTQQVLSLLPPALHDWFLHVVAVSVDRDIFPRQRDEAIVQLMYHDAFARVEWLDATIASDDRATQLYIACHRALLASDNYEITYHYFSHYFPAWSQTDMSDAQLQQLVKDMPQFHRQMQSALHHPVRDKLSRLMRPAAVPYRILRDISTEQEAFTDEEQLTTATKAAITGRIRKIRSRMNKRAWHSILFLFFTKTILAFLIEVPYELFLLQELHLGALAANVAFHPLLLFFLATTVRMPGASNTERIIEEVTKIVTGEGALPTIIVREDRHYGAVTWTFFALVYAVLFLVLFWLLFSFLALLQFSLVAIFMFVIFLGIVSFLAVRIRRSVSDIRLLPPRESAIGVMISFLSLPILEFGRWLTIQVNQLNVALFLMDRVLEAPFKILIDVVEEWFSFVRERREELT